VPPRDAGRGAAARWAPRWAARRAPRMVIVAMRGHVDHEPAQEHHHGEARGPDRASG
jgi:hypothetical protein